MKKLSLDYSGVMDFISADELKNMQGQVELAEKYLTEKNGAGNDFLGWVNLPSSYDKAEFEKIKKASERIRKESNALVVIGIGGSYLGARAAIEFMSHTFYNEYEKRAGVKIYYVGNNISGTYLSDLLDVLENQDYSINVISKSGTTTEPAIAFRVLREHLEKKYGAGAKDRIYATTDKNKGALKELATKMGYETFTIPDDVGGRFSVLTAVGLLPIACAGIDIDKLMEGAHEAERDCSLPENDCYKYAAIRNILNRKGKDIELLVDYEPRLHYIGEWWKQLFGESEGKDHKGIFPAIADFSTDLHSMGQYIQDGARVLFETALLITNPLKDVVIKKEDNDLDGLNYLAGKTMNYVNSRAALGTKLAHIEGGVPNMAITIPEVSPYYLGYLFYFFEKACGISGYILGVNPFNQPGVESYKKNMFALLGKKGYEEQADILNKKINK